MICIIDQAQGQEIWILAIGHCIFMDRDEVKVPYFFTYKPSDFFSFRPKILGDFSVTINNFALGL